MNHLFEDGRRREGPLADSYERAALNSPAARDTTGLQGSAGSEPGHGRIFRWVLPVICTGVIAAVSHAAFVEEVSPSKPVAVSAANRCEQCHTLDGMLSHPVRVIPQMAVPSHMPLEQGRVVCATCHDPEKHGKPGAGALLRQSPGSESFCTQCHSSSAMRGAKMHASEQMKAHLDHGTRRTGGVSAKMVSTLDAESRSCVGCHDGTMASDAGVHAAGLTLGADKGRDHPIGVAYKSDPSHADEGRLVEPSRLDPRIRLFDQTIGCGSCHSVYSPKEHLLVMSNLGSQLCLSCHVK